MILEWSLIGIGIVLLTLAVLIQFNVIQTFEPYANDYKWKPLGKTAWFPVFGNTFVYNNKLEYKKEGNYYRYRVIAHNGHVYDIVQIHPLYNGSVIQIANPTNPMTVEMSVQINDGRFYTSN